MKRKGGREVELKDEIQAVCDHLPASATKSLRRLTRQHGLTLASGDVSWLDGHWYVTHSGLLKIARRNRCHGIHVRPVVEFCDPSASRWVFKATVYTSRTCGGFIGFGDADPSNVSARMRGSELRISETRAIDRSLRAAYGVGLCSTTELKSFSGPLEPAPLKKPVQSENSNSNGNGNGHRLRDRLCLLIRQHQLDAALVKLYAADFCDTKELRDASREQVRDFVDHLAEYAVNDRDGLLCQLASYAPKPVSEVLVTIASDSPPNEGEKAAGAA